MEFPQIWIDFVDWDALIPAYFGGGGGGGNAWSN